LSTRTKIWCGFRQENNPSIGLNHAASTRNRMSEIRKALANWVAAHCCYHRMSRPVNRLLPLQILQPLPFRARVRKPADNVDDVLSRPLNHLHKERGA